MGKRATTSSRSCGEHVNPSSLANLTGKKVGRVFVDERWGTWKLYFLRICARFRRGSPWNRE